MKIITITLFCMLALFLRPAEARAEKSLVGQVISVDQKRGIMIVRAPQAGEAPEKGRPGRDITVVTGGRAFPSWLRTGLPVRLRGAFEKGSAVFKALSIETDRPKRFSADPTGVRRRLGREDLRQHHGGPDPMRGMHNDNRGRHGH